MSSDRFRFSRKVVLEDSQPQPDGAGGYQQSWVALGEHWASFAAFGGKTSEQGGAAVSSAGQGALEKSSYSACVNAPLRPNSTP